MKKLISVIIPVCNESLNISHIYEEVVLVLEKISQEFDYEIIFINDGSTDDSVEKIDQLASEHRQVKLIDFSRNFGKELAITAGLNYAAGDAAIIIDADLQHPPELIEEFISKWQAGAEMVIGIRKKNKRAGMVKQLGSLVFYNLMNLIGETEIKARATDYRLLDRKVINEFNRFTEHSRLTRGLIDWLGFKKQYIYFFANERKYGKAAYNGVKLFKLSLSAIISNSLVPLKIAGYLGFLIIIFSGPLGLFIFFDRYVFNNLSGFNFSGPAILALLNLFLTGIVLSCLGLIALYIGNIQQETTNRPLYIVREKKNFSAD